MNQRNLVSIVDDDDSIRESLSGLLRASGYDVHAYASAEEYLRSGESNQAQCLILDVCMPGMSGPECHDRLLRQGRTVPIVYITARMDDALRNELLRRGAIAYLNKPFEEEQLLDALRSACEKGEDSDGA